MAKLYCPSCGIDVEPFVLSGGGEEVVHCSICGLVLDADEALPTKAAAPQEALKCVLLAEDTDAIRAAVAEVLLSQHVAREVVPAKNGVEFISQATARLRDNLPLSLAILDVEMPLMNGVQAALSLRELEKQFGRKRKTPVLFFTTRKCDERFKQVLQKLQPSSYVNKGTSSNPEHLAQRVSKVLELLLKGKSAGA